MSWLTYGSPMLASSAGSWAAKASVCQVAPVSPVKCTVCGARPTGRPGRRRGSPGRTRRSGRARSRAGRGSVGPAAYSSLIQLSGVTPGHVDRRCRRSTSPATTAARPGPRTGCAGRSRPRPARGRSSRTVAVGRRSTAGADQLPPAAAWVGGELRVVAGDAGVHVERDVEPCCLAQPRKACGSGKSVGFQSQPSHGLGAFQSVSTTSPSSGHVVRARRRAAGRSRSRRAVARSTPSTRRRRRTAASSAAGPVSTRRSASAVA